MKHLVTEGFQGGDCPYLENMIKTIAMLREEYKDYVNPTEKIRRLVQQGHLIPIVRGIYETDRSTPGHYLASIIYGPSYLSFEFALGFYALIPEAVYNITSATFEKKKKEHKTPFGVFSYRDVPSDVYPYGIQLHSENGYGFQMASPEKAICDMLYKVASVRNKMDMEQLLFEDLRVDKDAFWELNLLELYDLAGRYKTMNHKLLRKLIRRRIEE